MSTERPSSLRVLSIVGAAWFLSLGFDLFLHAGLLAKLYVEESSFLLGPEDAFRRIPLGYFAFLILSYCLYWLFRRLGIQGWKPGARLGFAAGFIVWGALAAGLFSISTAGIPLLVGWWLGQACELGLAGAVLGSAAAGVPMKRIWIRVILGAFLCVAGAMTMQALGWAPAMKVVFS